MFETSRVVPGCDIGRLVVSTRDQLRLLDNVVQTVVHLKRQKTESEDDDEDWVSNARGGWVSNVRREPV